MQGIAEQRSDTSRGHVAVCIDSPVVRERALSVMATTSDHAFVATAGELTQRLLDERDAATLVDLPVLDVLVEDPALAASRPRWAASILLIVGDEPRRRLRSALRAGVGGLLEADRVESLPAVMDVARAGHLCVPGILRQTLGRPVLSQRERQTLALAFSGLTNAEIGVRLFVAPSTVKTHLSAAFQKLGVHSRSEAAALLHDPEEGLMELVLGSPFPPAGFALAGGAQPMGHRAARTATRDRIARSTPPAIGARPWSR